MLEPLGEHDLLVFWAQFTFLLIVARGLGSLFKRQGQPAVVGELLAGLLIGPSVFGRFLPDAAGWLFPGSTSESAPILTIAWVGVALLLLETGFETDLGLLRRLGRQAAAVSLGSLIVPLVMGFALGWFMPGDPFVGPAGSQFTFAAFIAVAMSISALPVVARILTELDLMRRDIAQVTVAAAMVNDLVGWILLGTLSGIVASGQLALGQSIVTVVAIAAFFTFALTIGQRLTDTSLRVARQVSAGISGPLTVTIVVMLVAATVTQAIGVEAVLGAFVAGIVIGRSPYQHPEVRRTIELLAAAVFAPIFFASAGIYVDLGAVASPSGLAWTVGVIVVATVAKLVGSYVGARAGGMTTSDGLAIGIGLNARGAMEIVLATIAFSLGVFSTDAYTIVVMMAIVTSLVAPPLLRRALRDVRPKGDEAARLEREEVLDASVIASTSRALLPTRGGVNAGVVATTLDLLLQPEAVVTVMTVHDPDAPPEECRCDEALGGAAAQFTRRTAARRRRTATDPAEAILAEAELGYGLVGVGLTEEFRDTHELSNVLQLLISHSKVPLLLVRHGAEGAVDVTAARRILVPVTGVLTGRAAEEVGAVLAAGLDAHLDLVHVVTRSDRGGDTGQRVPLDVGGRGTGTESTARSVLDQAVQRASRFGADATGSARTGAVTPEAILAAAQDLGSDLIVLSARSRAVEGKPFLGHGTEYLLEHAPQTVVTVIFPPEGEEGD
ncbi:MAG: cation:proton antiporter [Nitriliruptor sp.]|uniref:cation:proton antiporter domain-containing protein n=1 Tax=Nitriliruptor sp. TaxID=2448056 RepID=UPI0034A097B3